MQYQMFKYVYNYILGKFYLKLVLVQEPHYNEQWPCYSLVASVQRLSQLKKILGVIESVFLTPFFGRHPLMK